MEYTVMPEVLDNGIVKTGLTGVLNDRNQTLTVPWEVSQTGSKQIVFTRLSDNGKTYRITITVSVATSGGSSTATYSKGSYTIAEVLQNG